MIGCAVRKVQAVQSGAFVLVSANVAAVPPRPRRQRRVHPRAAGFTLIEILVVVTIIGILAAIIAPRFLDRPDEARVTRAKQDIQALVTALNLYRLDNFVYPTTDQGLQALVQKPAGAPDAPNWRAGGYIDRMLKDPWGNDYLFLSPGQRGDIDVYSFGADGQPGGEGVYADIGNWGE